MKSMISYILVPAIMPALFFLIALSPVEVLGCRTRGLLALIVAFVSGLAATFAAISGAKRKVRGDANAGRWIIRTLILVIPVIAMIIMA